MQLRLDQQERLTRKVGSELEVSEGGRTRASNSLTDHHVFMFQIELVHAGQGP